MNYCENCGNKLIPGDNFCRNCGAAISGVKKDNEPETIKVPDTNQKNPQPDFRQQQTSIPNLSKQNSQKDLRKNKSPWKAIIIFWVISFILLLLIAGGIAGYFIYTKKVKTATEDTRTNEQRIDKNTNSDNNISRKENTNISTEKKTVGETTEKKYEAEKKTGFQKREKRAGDCGDYPELSERKLNPSELEGLSAKEIRYMRNDIYMRHGYIFRDEELLLHYAMFPCYEPKHMNVEKYLSDIEKYNIKLLKEVR